MHQRDTTIYGPGAAPRAEWDNYELTEVEAARLDRALGRGGGTAHWSDGETLEDALDAVGSAYEGYPAATRERLEAELAELRRKAAAWDSLWRLLDQRESVRGREAAAFLRSAGAAYGWPIPVHTPPE